MAGGWNKGLTKSDPRVRKYAETFSNRCKSGDIIPWQTGQTKETDTRILNQSLLISDKVNQLIVNGDWHNSFSKSRRQSYKNESFDGKWEVLVAKWFDEQNIVWIRNKSVFSYTFNEKQRKYTPDFYLPNNNCYVEIKGWKTPKDEAKWAYFPNLLVVLSGTDLKSLGLIDIHKDWKSDVDIQKPNIKIGLQHLKLILSHGLIA